MKLISESVSWISDYQRGGQILQEVAANLAERRDGNEIRALANEVLTWRSRIFGDSLHMFLGELADDLQSPEFH